MAGEDGLDFSVSMLLSFNPQFPFGSHEPTDCQSKSDASDSLGVPKPPFHSCGSPWRTRGVGFELCSEYSCTFFLSCIFQ